MLIVMAPGWKAHAEGHMLRFQRQITQEVANDARQNIVDAGLVRSGALLDSVSKRDTRVYVGTDHWAPHEYGARPHTIRPAVKRALWWEGLEHPISHANHPGNREHGFMRRAIHKKRG